MNIKYTISLLVGLIVLATALYFFIPYIRYKLIPFTGGTLAPRMLADTNSMVLRIEDVPVQDGWINSEPLEFDQLYKQNKVVLIDFWTYSCINCIRATPYTQELWERFKDHGLVVIGVHSPEFDFEKDPKNILAGIEKAGITYPVLTDGDMKVWKKFGNHFWPAKYLINQHGRVIYTQFGEGNYAQEEHAIHKALVQAGWTPPHYGAPTKHLEPVAKKVTPELYAGPKFLRKRYGNLQQPKEGTTTTFNMPERLQKDAIYLKGAWRADRDYTESVSDGKIALTYTANAPYIVLDIAPSHTSVLVEVQINDKPAEQSIRGEDIIKQDGKTYMRVDQARLYYPTAHNAPYGTHTITFITPPGLRLYAFTFGAY